MYARCYRPSHEAYLRYSKLEKAICDEWKNDYIVFLQWSLENGYSDKLQIDRIDNLKGYSPENCRWVTTKIQQSNKQNSLPPMLAFGEYKTPIEWAEDERCVVSRIRLVKRINSGISLEDAITKLKLVRRRNQLSEITKQRMSEKAILQNSNDRRDEISGRYTSYTKLPNQA